MIQKAKTNKESYIWFNHSVPPAEMNAFRDFTKSIIRAIILEECNWEITDVKKNGAFRFGISFFVLKIYTFLYYASFGCFC